MARLRSRLAKLSDLIFNITQPVGRSSIVADRGCQNRCRLSKCRRWCGSRRSPWCAKHFLQELVRIATSSEFIAGPRDYGGPAVVIARAVFLGVVSVVYKPAWLLTTECTRPGRTWTLVAGDCPSHERLTTAMAATGSMTHRIRSDVFETSGGRARTSCDAGFNVVGDGCADLGEHFRLGAVGEITC